jgi:hypothetical protein
MNTQLKYNKQIKANTMVYIIDNKSIKTTVNALKIDKGNQTYLTSKLKNGDFAYVIKDGNYIIITKYTDLKKPENKEKLRQIGFKIFELLKKAS